MTKYLFAALFYLFGLPAVLAENIVETKTCVPSTPPDCGVRINKKLEEDRSIKTSKYFQYRYPNDVEKEYKLLVDMQAGSSPSIEITASASFAYSKNADELKITSKSVNASRADGKELKVSEKKESVCKYNSRGDALSEGCYFAVTSSYALPTVALNVGQNTTDRISVPYNLQGKALILDIEREFTLVDYIKVNQRTLARLQIKEKLLSAKSTDIITECPSVYYTSTRLLYLDIESMLPYNVLSLTKLGIKDQLGVQIVIKVEE